MGPRLSWAHVSIYLCKETGSVFADKLAAESFLGDLRPLRQWPAPLKNLPLRRLPLKLASLQGSFRGLTQFALDTLRSNQLHCLEQMM